jgi:inosine-uridine nucleoside N-ribohydrolase
VGRLRIIVIKAFQTLGTAGCELDESPCLVYTHEVQLKRFNLGGGGALIPVLIDTDPGIDDAVALMLALRASELEVRAVTACSGNLRADLCALNALRVLDYVGRPDVPVAVGALSPLTRPYPRDPFSHGDDGLGNTGLAASKRKPDPRFAADLIVDTAEASDNQLTIIALGPLTNLALALLRKPDLARYVRSVVLTGGAFGLTPYSALRATGDNPVSEWNIYVDPEAARLVFHSDLRITAVGLDVSCDPRINLDHGAQERLKSSESPEARFLTSVLAFVTARGFEPYSAIIDALTAAIAIDRGLAKTTPLKVEIETQSPLSLGQTVADRREHFRWEHLPTIDVVSEVDYSAFHTLLLSSFVTERAMRQ